MNKLFIAIFTLLTFSSFGQGNPIEEWQHKNPFVIFMESSDADQKVVDQLIASGREVIIYQGEITVEDLHLYDAQYNSEENNNSLARLQNSDYVKVWLAQNPDVKIIPNSYYSQLSNGDRAIYEKNNAMVLSGESITIEDIHNYENTH